MIYLALWLVGTAIFAAGFALGAAWRGADPWEEMPSEVDPDPLSSSRDRDHPTFRVVPKPPFDQEREA